MNEYDYTGDKTKNYFTAYLQKCIRWKMWNYLKKKEKIGRTERPLEESLEDFSSSIDEMLELRYKEAILSREWKDDIQYGMNYQIKGLQKPY
ncbi:hypothetical protein [Sellimonas caecigallum]|uniref:hypothetical protein n=2 Tax=Sellimonas TaxID=1769710 RepID=UPI001FEB8682|nr:hypothetical protein [Sellimonas caecigallum]